MDSGASWRDTEHAGPGRGVRGTTATGHHDGTERSGPNAERVRPHFVRLTTADRLKTYTVERYENITALAAIYHVVEHFGMHCGQILYVTKLLSGTDLGFYRQLSGWVRRPEE